MAKIPVNSYEAIKYVHLQYGHVARYFQILFILTT